MPRVFYAVKTEIGSHAIYHYSSWQEYVDMQKNSVVTQVTDLFEADDFDHASLIAKEKLN